MCSSFVVYQARTGSLAIEDMDGGTFTISNGGVFGSLFGTPIINLPQSAILGMYGVFDRPVAVKGKVRGQYLRSQKTCGIIYSAFPTSVYLSVILTLVETI